VHGEQGMSAVFSLLAAITVIYSVIKYWPMRKYLIATRPPHVRGNLLVRFFSFNARALEPSTPLLLQTDYMKSLWAGCVALFFMTLSSFAGGDEFSGGFINVLLDVVVLVLTVWEFVSTVKSSRKYRENCDRAAGRI
jgi:hypothetical protein